MDLNRLFQMVINQLLRKAMNGGLNAAMQKISRMSAGTAPVGPAQKKAQAAVNERARQATKLTRKF